MATLSPGQLPAMPALEALLGQYLTYCPPQPTASGADLGRTTTSDEQLSASFQAAEKAGGAGRHRGQVTGQMLRDNFHLPLHTVAKKFGMCTTAFKKLCRRFEIPKWPHRQVICSRLCLFDNMTRYAAR